jgi:hypothetical protein
MTLGAGLYRLSRRRLAVGLSLLIAIAACVLTLYRPSLSGLQPRGLQIGAASTDLLIARPNLVVGGESYEYDALVNRAILVGNEIVGPPVLSYIGHALGVPASRIQGSAPMTANVPRVLIEPGSGGSAMDIVASPDHYKLEVQADPSVPILHLYAQAPSASQAIKMATAAVQGVDLYLQRVEAADNVAPRERVTVQQLGPARGGVANPGASKQIALLVFVGVFGVSLWFMTLAARVRDGWLAARLTQQPQP